jgi:hypothetical protein
MARGEDTRNHPNRRPVRYAEDRHLDPNYKGDPYGPLQEGEAVRSLNTVEGRRIWDATEKDIDK